jgi:hypothetical protein
MANVASTPTKKVVRLSEDALVDLIDGILNETIAVKKQEWLNEQKKVQVNKTTLLEGKVAVLEKKINLLLKDKA